MLVLLLYVAVVPLFQWAGGDICSASSLHPCTDVTNNSIVVDHNRSDEVLVTHEPTTSTDTAIPAALHSDVQVLENDSNGDPNHLNTVRELSL